MDDSQHSKLVKEYDLEKDFSQYREFRIVEDPRELENDEFKGWVLLKVIPNANTITTKYGGISHDIYASKTTTLDMYVISDATSTAGNYNAYSTTPAYYTKKPKSKKEETRTVTHYVFGRRESLVIKAMKAKLRAMDAKMKNFRRWLDNERKELKEKERDINARIPKIREEAEYNVNQYRRQWEDAASKRNKAIRDKNRARDDLKIAEKVIERIKQEVRDGTAWEKYAKGEAKSHKKKARQIMLDE